MGGSGVSFGSEFREFGREGVSSGVSSGGRREGVSEWGEGERETGRVAELRKGGSSYGVSELWGIRL